jgi:uncharacterized membrane protein (DUF485 family)
VRLPLPLPIKGLLIGVTIAAAVVSRAALVAFGVIAMTAVLA